MLCLCLKCFYEEFLKPGVIEQVRPLAILRHISVLALYFKSKGYSFHSFLYYAGVYNVLG